MLTLVFFTFNIPFLIKNYLAVIILQIKIVNFVLVKEVFVESLKKINISYIF